MYLLLPLPLFRGATCQTTRFYCLSIQFDPRPQSNNTCCTAVQDLLDFDYFPGVFPYGFVFCVFCIHLGIVSTMASFRICATSRCNARLPDIKNDGHSRCKDCVGHVCTPENKCEECIVWTDDVFSNYIKHRRQLELTRARQAKNRKLNKDKRTGNVKVSVTDKGKVKVNQHEMSSSVGSSAKSDPGNIIDLDVSRSLVYSFDSSTSSLSVPNAPINQSPNKPSAPLRDQGNTDLSKRVDDLTAKVNLVVDLLVNKLKSNPQVADLQPMPSRELVGLAPQLPDVLLEPSSGGTAADGRLREGTCPLVASQHLDRSRKRSREPKDAYARIKRSRRAVGSAETRSRNARQSFLTDDDNENRNADVSDNEVRNDGSKDHSSMKFVSPGNVDNVRNDTVKVRNVIETVNESVSRDLTNDDTGRRYDGAVAKGDAVVARDAGVAARNDGSIVRDISNVSQGKVDSALRSSSLNLSQVGNFEESMEIRLRQICYENAGLSSEEQMTLMRKCLKTHDPHNTSWVSNRSVRSKSRDERKGLQNSVMSCASPVKSSATKVSTWTSKTPGKVLPNPVNTIKPSGSKPVRLSPSGIVPINSDSQLGELLNISKPSASSTPKSDSDLNSLLSVVHKSPPKTPLAVKMAMRMAFGTSNPSSEVHRPMSSPRVTDRHRSVRDEVSEVAPQYMEQNRTNPVETSCKIIQLGALSPKKGNFPPKVTVESQSEQLSCVSRLLNQSNTVHANSHILQDKAGNQLNRPKSGILTSDFQNAPGSCVPNSVSQNVTSSGAGVRGVSGTLISQSTGPVTYVHQGAPQASIPRLSAPITITSGLDTVQQVSNPDKEINVNLVVSQVSPSSVPRTEGLVYSQGIATNLTRESSGSKHNEVLEPSQLNPPPRTPSGNQPLSVLQTSGAPAAVTEADTPRPSSTSIAPRTRCLLVVRG